MTKQEHWRWSATDFGSLNILIPDSLAASSYPRGSTFSMRANRASRSTSHFPIKQSQTFQSSGVSGVDVDKFEQRVQESFRRQAFMATLGAELKTPKLGEIEIGFPFHPSLTQQNDFVHAGAITSILD